MFDKPEQCAVVLSDIHIGDNTPACWYQDRVHFSRLAGVLDWVVANRASVREVIFLGDTFDFWTYAPSRRPPRMSDIIRANPRLLGAGGPLASLVRALPGRVRLLPGNHDENLTRSDIRELNASLTGNPNTGIQLVTEPRIVLTGASGARTLFEHGHRWCMFNAPDPKSRWKELPVGHFVSRGIAHRLVTRHPDKTAADLPSQGNGDMGPVGTDFLAVLWRAVRRFDLNVVEELLLHVTRKTGLPQDAAILMPRATPSSPIQSSLRDARAVFGGLFADWVRAEGGKKWNAARAAAADATGDDLAWFALRQALLSRADLVVMGHTHTAVKGLTVAPLGVEYVNSGFECVSLPDAAKGTEFTFAHVDLEAPRARVIAVEEVGGRIRLVPSRRARTAPVVVRRKSLPIPFEDFSCYVRVENRSRSVLRLVQKSLWSNNSIWVVPPPDVIPAGGRADIWLQDRLGTRGSSGRFTYTDGASNLNFRFSCPSGVPVPLPNQASVGVTPSRRGAPPSGLVVNYEARAGNDPWRQRDITYFGHPVQMRCVVGVPATGPGPGGKAAGNGGVRLPPRGDRIVEGAEHLFHTRYLMTVGGRHVVNTRAVDAARGRRIRWQPSGLVATIDSVRVEDQGPQRGGRRLRVVITLRVVDAGTSGLRVGGTVELAWRALSHAGRVESLAPA